MTEFVPGGYISIREALNRLGRELFPSDWTGEEHKAHSGLIGEDEWLHDQGFAPGAWWWCAHQWGCAGKARRSFRPCVSSGVQGE